MVLVRCIRVSRLWVHASGSIGSISIGSLTISSLFIQPIHSDPRYFSGLLSAVVSGFLTFVFLEPLFVPVGLDLALVALWVLSINASLVGLSLGVLLPSLFPGLCFGVTFSLLVGSFLDLSYSLYLPVVGGACALLGALLSSK